MTSYQIYLCCQSVSVILTEHFALGTTSGCLNDPVMRTKVNENLASIAKFLGVHRLWCPESPIPHVHADAISMVGNLILWYSGITEANTRRPVCLQDHTLKAARELFQVFRLENHENPHE